MMTLQEYEIEIKLENIDHEKCLCKLANESKDNKDECRDKEDEEYVNIHQMVFHIIEMDTSYESGWENEAQVYEREILQIPTSTDSQYYDLK